MSEVVKSETVKIGRAELTELIALAELQEDTRYSAQTFQLSRFAPRRWDREDCGAWAARLRNAVQVRAYGQRWAAEGEYDVNGDTERRFREPADLSPVGLGSVYGRVLLELARRFEAEEARERRRREENEVDFCDTQAEEREKS